MDHEGRLAEAGRAVNEPNEPTGFDVVSRIVAEFTEMPGLSVTIPQATRLFGLTPEKCHDVFADLQRRGVLAPTPQGQYRIRNSE
jgi:hypothetical protein